MLEQELNKLSNDLVMEKVKSQEYNKEVGAILLL